MHINSFSGTMRLSNGYLQQAEQDAFSNTEDTQITFSAADDTTKHDRITLSAEAKSLANAPQETDASEEKSAAEIAIDNIKDRIKKIQEEIKETQNKDLPEKEKQQKIAMLQQELMQNYEQLAQLQQKMSDGPTVGGTDAKVFASSLT